MPTGYFGKSHGDLTDSPPIGKRGPHAVNGVSVFLPPFGGRAERLGAGDGGAVEVERFRARTILKIELHI